MVLAKWGIFATFALSLAIASEQLSQSKDHVSRSGTTTHTIMNLVLSAVISEQGLTQITMGQDAVDISNDSFSIQVGSVTVTPDSCTSTEFTNVTNSSIMVINTGCPDPVKSVTVSYWLQTLFSGYVSKVLIVEASKGPAQLRIGSVMPWGSDGIQLYVSGTKDSPVTVIRSNPFNPSAGDIAGFVRFKDTGSGAFVSVTNPFTRMTPSSTQSSGCIKGINYKFNDLPGQPNRTITSAIDCRATCTGDSHCAGYVWNAATCEDSQPPGNCFLKASVGKANQEQCSCSLMKPFPPPNNGPTLLPSTIQASYNAGMNMDVAGDSSLIHITDESIVGVTSIGKYTFEKYTLDEPVYTTERAAFVASVEEHYLDLDMRSNQTVKVNVAWDENDYQIDVGTVAGQTEYHRIIDRNAQFGSSHIVYEPANSLRGSRFNTTDGWGWEGSLWLSMGELIREGSWDPVEDAVPPEILDMLQYAASKGVKLMAYVYPCLPFQPLKDYWVAGSNPNTVDLSQPAVQEWFITRMLAFTSKTGIGGWAWDHNIFAGPASLQYSQWRGWMKILGALRSAHPGIVMDHRQTAHAWGPWYQLAGSYDEPIAGDENPETYGVPIASLHTDHVAADNTRIVNFKYAAGQLIPPSRIPGFIFHQTERTADNGTSPCFKNEKLCYDNNIRDFDLLGYKYSLLSTIGTAGQNNVLTMIPARDPEEFRLFPKADLDFIQNWLSWTDENLKYLRNTVPIAQLGPPSIGSVDGTASMYDDEGFIFLYNPGFLSAVANLTIDEAIGISNGSAGAKWIVSELYPSQFKVDTWSHGASVSVSVGGSDCRVLQLTRTTITPDLVGSTGFVDFDESSNKFVINGVTGDTGTESMLKIPGFSNISLQKSSVKINGVECTGAKYSNSGDLLMFPKFAGDVVQHAMPISASAVPQQPWNGGWLNTTFVIPAAMKQQSINRTATYPIDWQPADFLATWLVPQRLLIYIFIDNPRNTLNLKLEIDGGAVNVTGAYNSRGRKESRTFLGYYYDASALPDSVPHSLNIYVPQSDFIGLFWENVETLKTDVIVAC